MKKLILLFVLIALFTLSAAAARIDEATLDTLTDMECMVKGYVRVEKGDDLYDFVENLRIIDDSEKNINTDKFLYFCQSIEQLFYKPITAQEVFDRFAEKVRYVDVHDMTDAYVALFSVLDKYSYYLTPEQSETFWNPTVKKGIGITLVHDDTGEAWGQIGTFVEGVANGSTAAAAGVEMGDRIVSLFGINVADMPFSAVRAMLAGIDPELEEMQITLERDGELIDLTLRRTSTAFREYTFHLYPEKKAFMLVLSSFSNYSTAFELIERMKELRSQGYVNAILDLRNNSGGDVQVAASVIGAFLDYEQMLFSMGRGGYRDYYVFRSLGIGVRFKSLYVLVNENTASSAEITAQCLRQHAGAVLVGTSTVGKAVAQNVARLIDGSTYGVTTFVAYDCHGETYNEVGLVPRFHLHNETVKYDFPTDLEHFNYINYVEAHEGAENDVVVALERRLEMMGMMDARFVDGVWDSATTDSVKAIQLAEGYELTGKLDGALVQLITDVINSYKNMTVTLDTQLRFVLEMIR